MDLATWTSKGSDPARIRRLGVGYVVGGLAVVGLVLGLSRMAAAVPMPDEDDALDVTLASQPPSTTPEPEPTPEQAPEPEPTPEQAAPAPAPRPRPQAPNLRQPTAIPTGAPREREADGSSAGGADPYADAESGGGEAAGPPAPAAPPTTRAPTAPPPAPRPRPPVKATQQDVTPPKALSRTAPAYPASAKAAGIEGTVVVRYVVTESGDATEVSATSGPPELRPACVAAVASWRFEPARSEGRPVRYAATARFPFRIKT